MRWEIDHAAKFVYIVAVGPITLQNMEGRGTRSWLAKIVP